MLKYALIALMVALGIISIVFFRNSEEENSNSEQIPKAEVSEKAAIQDQVTKTSIPENSLGNNLNEIVKTEKELVKTIEEIPEKIEPSDRMKKIRTEDGHVMLYDKEGRLIKKELPDGKIELYNYTRDGERILVEN